LINNITNNTTNCSSLITQPPLGTSGLATGAISSAISSTEPDLNLDGDRYSTVSDSAAWSTDHINNSDSDLESNSPSKYTPYSTHSSSSSHQHGALNQALFFQSLNQSQQISNPNVAASNAQSYLASFTNTANTTYNQISQSALSANSGIDSIVILGFYTNSLLNQIVFDMILFLEIEKCNQKQ